MDERAIWVPGDVDADTPSAARVYDYLLGGGHNFDSDRQLAEKLLTVLPARDMARLNREFLRRVVLEMAALGIRQFIDLGSGIPTVGNVHEVVHAVHPDARVVYVDYEMVAAVHSELMLADEPNAAMVHADMREPEQVLQHEHTKRLIDFSEPVGLLMVGVVQFIADADDPWALAAQYRDAIPAGSYFALSAFTTDNAPAGMAAAIEVFKNSQDPIYPRTREEILRLFDGYTLLEPGLVYTPQWRPQQPELANTDAEASRSNLYAGLGIKD